MKLFLAIALITISIDCLAQDSLMRVAQAEKTDTVYDFAKMSRKEIFNFPVSDTLVFYYNQEILPAETINKKLLMSKRLLITGLVLTPVAPVIMAPGIVLLLVDKHNKDDKYEFPGGYLTGVGAQTFLAGVVTLICGSHMQHKWYKTKRNILLDPVVVRDGVGIRFKF
jgi:hypothetical protein